MITCLLCAHGHSSLKQMSSQTLQGLRVASNIWKSSVVPSRISQTLTKFGMCGHPAGRVLCQKAVDCAAIGFGCGHCLQSGTSQTACRNGSIKALGRLSITSLG
jgi:hypothetical protein